MNLEQRWPTVEEVTEDNTTQNTNNTGLATVSFSAPIYPFKTRAAEIQRFMTLLQGTYMTGLSSTATTSVIYVLFQNSC